MIPDKDALSLNVFQSSEFNSARFGVVEGFFRTLNEQIVCGGSYETVEDLSKAVGKFVALYNGECRIGGARIFKPQTGRIKFLDKVGRLMLNSCPRNRGRYNPKNN